MKYNTKDLCEMLSYQRGTGSRMEMIFIRKYIDPIRPQVDKYTNRHKIIGNPDTIFTAHTDTVHPFNSHRQKIYVHKNIAMTDGKSVLGGDDTTGIWILLNMIHAKIPGHYIFQRSEENGGIGSGYSSQKQRSNIKKVISFDRKGFTDIITHQGGRTCSDEFAWALANAIGKNYRPSRGGIFTDSANYADDIPECTNVSIGYLNAHTPRETQDLNHAKFLIRQIQKINFKKLPVKRDPHQRFDPYYKWNESSFNFNKKNTDWWSL